MDLTTTYLGVKLRTPLVPSASPLSEDLDFGLAKTLVRRSSARPIARSCSGTAYLLSLAIPFFNQIG
jgi:hypothetical protein